jgi:hypothetical protein
MMKIGQAFIALSASQFHHIMFAEATDPSGTSVNTPAPDAAAQLAAMQAQLAAAKAEAQANQAKADAHLAQMEAQKQQNKAALDAAKAQADQAMAQAANAKNNAATLANMGMQNKVDELTERLGKATGGVWDAKKTVGNLQAAAVNNGIDLNPTNMMGELPNDVADAASRLANQAPAIMSGAASPMQVMKNIDLSESLGAENQAAMRSAMQYANVDGLKKLDSQIDSFDVKNVNLNNAVVQNLLGAEDTAEIASAFEKEKKILQEQGVKGVINQFRTEIADPQKLPLDMYAHQMHDTLGNFGINFDETKIHDAIAGFNKMDLDSVAEQLKDKAMKADYKKVLHKTVGKVENFTKDGIPGMWDKMWHKKHKTAGHMLHHVGGGDAKEGLKHVLAQHRREVHMSKLEQFYNDSWQHIMMNLVALFILCLALAYLFIKYRTLLKEKRKAML